MLDFHRCVAAATLALVFAAPARAQDENKERAPDDSNVPLPPPVPEKPERPEVSGKSAGGGNELGLHVPWHLEPSPEWTQDRGWPATRFWRLDHGAFEVEVWYQAKVHRPRAGGKGSNGTEHFWQGEIEVGILPGIQLDVYENLIKEPGEPVNQEGNQIELRIAPWNYGAVPANPTLYLEWHPVHKGDDRWEVRLLVGGSPFERFFLAANSITEMETGGDRMLEWGFTGAASYEVVPGALRIGAETRITWEFSQQHDDSPTDGFDAEIGPNVFFRPLALVKEEWGHWLKISCTALFGLNGDRSSEFLRAILVVGCEF
ncbi:hypothetical protein HY251_20870 [bacterium]|nr:hypothetical protein [bacterium]